jgi:hypothetical protein
MTMVDRPLEIFRSPAATSMYAASHTRKAIAGPILGPTATGAFYDGSGGRANLFLSIKNLEPAASRTGFPASLPIPQRNLNISNNTSSVSVSAAAPSFASRNALANFPGGSFPSSSGSFSSKGDVFRQTRSNSPLGNGLGQLSECHNEPLIDATLWTVPTRASRRVAELLRTTALHSSHEPVLCHAPVLWKATPQAARGEVVAFRRNQGQH